MEDARNQGWLTPTKRSHGDHGCKVLIYHWNHYKIIQVVDNFLLVLKSQTYNRPILLQM